MLQTLMINPKTGAKPRLHPNGFIQLDIEPDWFGWTRRLHVWPDEPLPAQKTRHPIHDHAFDMESRIVCGALTNKTFTFRPSMERKDYALHQARHIGSEETVLEPTGEVGYLDAWSSCTYWPGAAYALGAGVLHDSVAWGLTATVMSRSKGVGHEPSIAVPYGVKPDNDFRRDQLSEEILWGWISKVMDQWTRQQAESFV